MRVRIYSPSKTATQSGRAKTKKWYIEPEIQAPLLPESLMGWTSASDTHHQIKLGFATAQEAIDYAEKKNWEYTVDVLQEKQIKPKTYMDNYKYKPPQKDKK